jgi:hypothetical protein
VDARVFVGAGLGGQEGAQGQQRDRQQGRRPGEYLIERFHDFSSVRARAMRRACFTCCAPNVEKK